VVGLAGLWLAKHWKIAPWQGYLWLALCLFSHPLLDMLTNGGVGIALLWPFSGERWFSPWRPVEVSPVAFSRFFTQRGADVLLNEVKTIWLPLMTLALTLFAFRQPQKS
jgi:inner membrane protein